MLRHLKKKIRQHQVARLSLLTCALAAAMLAVLPSEAWADTTNTDDNVTIENTDTLTGNLYNRGDYVTIENTGTITGCVVNYGNYVTIENTDSSSKINYGIYNNAGRTITAIINAGTIGNTTSDNGYGIKNNAASTIGTIENSGTIYSCTDGILNDYGITSTYTSAYIGTIENSGTISGGTCGIRNYSDLTSTGTSAYIGTIENSGTISGGTCGILNDSGGTIGTIENSGNITGGTYGIKNTYTIGSTSTGLSNSGAITGGTDGIYNTGTIYSLTNSGTITGTSNAGIENAGTATVTNTGTITGGSYGIYNTGGTLTITNSGSGTISGSTYLAYVTDGTVTINNENGGNLTGATNVASTGTLNLNLSDSTWEITGDSSLTSLALNSDSVLKFVSGSYYNLSTATLSGSGSTIYLYTNLAANSLDTITITSAATGSYTLYITNTGSAPTNLYTAYKIIDLSSATTNTATFTSNLSLGIWRYALAEGSSLSSAYTDSTTGSTVNASDYYLYNTFTPTDPVLSAISESASGKVMWYGEMNEIKKRLGDLRSGQQSSGDIWARTYGERYNVHTGSTSFSQSVHGGEIGKDNPQSFVGGKKFTGVLLGAGQADGTFSSGTGATKSVYAGAYGSWLYDNGVYCDLIGKYNWFTNSFATSSDTGKYKNTGVGLSVEAGKRFDKGNGKYIQPEAELSYLRAGSANYLTSAGLTVDDPTASSLQLRLGISAGKTWHTKDGTSRSYYGKLSIQNEFQGATTYVENYGFDSSLKGHQLIAGIGFTEDNKRHSIYIDLEHSQGSAVSKPWGYNVGCRWKL